MAGYEARRRPEMQGHCDSVGCHSIGYYEVKEMDGTRSWYNCARHLPGPNERIDFIGIEVEAVIQEALDLGVEAGEFVKGKDGRYRLAGEGGE